MNIWEILSICITLICGIGMGWNLAYKYYKRVMMEEISFVIDQIDDICVIESLEPEQREYATRLAAKNYVIDLQTKVLTDNIV